MQLVQQLPRFPRERFLRLAEVEQTVGIKKSAIYAKMNEKPPAFPQPVKLSRRAVAWPESAVQAWIQSQIAGLGAVCTTVQSAPDAHQVAPAAQAATTLASAPTTKAKAPTRAAAAPAGAAGTTPQAMAYEPFTVDETGVWFNGADQDGKRKPPEWVCSPLTVEALTRDQDGTGGGYLLAFNDPLGNPRTWAMPARMLSGDGVEYRATLLNKGLRIAATGRARNHLTHYLQSQIEGAAK